MKLGAICVFIYRIWQPYLISAPEKLSKNIPFCGLLGWCSGKDSACQCRRFRRLGFNPWVGKIPLEEGMATHSSTLAWRIPWTEEAGGLQSMGSHGAGHVWAHTCIPFRIFILVQIISTQFKIYFLFLLAKEVCGRVWLLAAQKPTDRPGWWKEKFALCQTPATREGGGQTSVRRLTPPTQPPTSGAGAFTGRVSESGELHPETAQSSSSGRSSMVWLASCWLF